LQLPTRKRKQIVALHCPESSAKPPKRHKFQIIGAERLSLKSLPRRVPAKNMLIGVDPDTAVMIGGDSPNRMRSNPGARTDRREVTVVISNDG
jgi:hypothetical protein